MVQVLITAAELMRRQDAGDSLALLDMRWHLDRPEGRAIYAQSHIPGAVYVDLETELSVPGHASEGRHPLPDAAAIQRAARSWGLRDGQQVVAYDDLGGMSAARLWWILRDCGVETMLLDGGLQAWEAAGGALETGEIEPTEGDVVLASGHMPQLSIDEAAALPASGTLVDARAPERYRGEVEPIDPQAGHIPGARNLPTSGNLDADGRFLSADALRNRFAAAGLTSGQQIGVYCGSGVTAAHEIAALEHVGIRAALYSGSWSQWSNTPDLPIETGGAVS